MAEPMEVVSKMEQVNPTFTRPATEAPLLIRAKRRRDKDEPAARNSKTLADE
jgi:hypothetical protein